MRDPVSRGSGATLCWLAGEVMPLDAARVPLRDRGFLSGEGAFETVRVVRGRPFRLAAHLGRLAAASRALGIEGAAAPLAGAQAAAEALLAARGAEDGVLKIIITAGDPPALAPSLIALAGPPRPLPPGAREEGVGATLAPWPHPGRSPAGGAKTLANLDRSLARRLAAREGAWEAIFLDAGGRVAEGAVTNVFWVRGGALFTPALDLGIVPGIARAAVIALAREAGIPTHEGGFPCDELAGADEAFITNALVGALPLRKIGDRPLARVPGPFTRALAARLEDLVLAETSAARAP
jgi:branched-subunit amino acid aminotransferase/4-amino-4-deoxychorismate lyase